MSNLETPFGKKKAETLLGVPFVDMRTEKERKIEKDPRRGATLGRETDRLVAELAEIGRHEGFLSTTEGGNFSGEWGGSFKHVRARAIGETINQSGGIELMKAAYYRVQAKLGGGAARELEVCWNYIGSWKS